MNAISYHTFLYPFTYDVKTIKPVDELWKLVNHKDVSITDKINYYNQINYFMPKAERLLFPKENENNGNIDYEYVDKGLTLTFYRDGAEELHLKVNNIKLKVISEYSIGLLSIETENDTYSDLETINWINDCGRRVFDPTIAEGNIGINGLSVLTPKKVTLTGSKKIVKEFIRNKNESEIDFFSDGHPEFLERIIFGKDEGILKPVLDDRMFVATYADNSKIRVSNKEGDSQEVSYINLIEENGEELYKFMFLEHGSCTCQNDELLKEKLKEKTYRRWSKWGTIYGISEYSLACLSNDPPVHIVNTFLTIYVSLVSIALINRAIMTKMESNIRSDSDVTVIKNKWEKYVKFQAEYYTPEVTFQEQGVEIYDMIKKALRLEEMYEYLRGDMENLRVLAAMKAEDDENEKLDLLTKISALLPLVTILMDYINGGFSSENLYIIMGAITFAFVIIVGGMLWHKNVWDLELKQNKRKQGYLKGLVLVSWTALLVFWIVKIVCC